jgi:hypothetical protein
LSSPDPLYGEDVLPCLRLHSATERTGGQLCLHQRWGISGTGKSGEY